MSVLSSPAVLRLRTAVLVPLLLLTLALWWTTTRSGSEAAGPAAPAARSSQTAGRITFDALPGAVTATLPLRSFGVGGTSPAGTSGGGGTGKFIPDDPTAVVDASSIDPLLLQTVTTGVHLAKVTVTLFRPGTTDRQEVWQLGGVTMSQVRSSQSGSSKAPRVSLALHYTQVTATTYDAKGAVARTYCFALDTNTAC